MGGASSSKTMVSVGLNEGGLLVGLSLLSKDTLSIAGTKSSSMSSSGMGDALTDSPSSCCKYK